MTRAQPYHRETALDAALLLFWEKGYQGTSLKDLEAALHMKPGSIYSAFSSKENLFNLVLERYFVHNRDTFTREVTNAQSPLTALVNKIREIALAQEGDPQRLVCMLVRTVLNATCDDRVAADNAGQYRVLMQAEMARAFEKAMELGELSSNIDPKELARNYQSHMMLLQIDAHLELDPDKFGRFVEETAQEYEKMRVAEG